MKTLIYHVEEKAFPNQTECGDIFLVGIVHLSIPKKRTHIDWLVITATESGWIDSSGQSRRSIDDITYWMKLEA